MAGGGANLLTVPTELFKIRMQMEAKRRAAGLPPRINNVIHGLTSTVRRNGFYGLWGGVGPTTWRGALHTLADVGTYDFFKRSLIKVLGIPDNRGIHFVAALLSGIAVVVLSNPPDVVRSRVMFQPRDKRGRGLHFKNGRQCFMRLIREEGIMAMYKGWLPFWLRVGPWTFIFWFTFEHLRGRRGDQHRYN
ncbi:mitochondrial uncoupling protein 4-like isoform X2 [Drosophila bipectinata]